MIGRGSRLFLWLVALPACASSLLAWEAIEWEEATVRVSDRAGWRAIVSENQGRLVYLGPSDGSVNILAANGHRWWTGPQTEWPKWWPPPAAWETNRPVTLESRGGVLRAVSPPTSLAGWPDLDRTYAWLADGVLRIEGGWTGGERAVQGLHILHLQTSAVVTARPDAGGWWSLPTFAHRDWTFHTEPPAPLRTRVPDGEWRMEYVGEETKAGFSPQSLRARVGRIGIVLTAEPWSAPQVESLDQGRYAQVYFGSARYPAVEIEQATARLAPSANRQVFAVRVALTVASAADMQKHGIDRPSGHEPAVWTDKALFPSSQPGDEESAPNL